MSDPGSNAVVSLWHSVPAHPVGRAVILPGGSGYTVDHPLLWWTAQVLAENGWRVVIVRWTIDDAARADPTAFVADAAEHALDLAGPAERTLIVGKSFGTFAVPWAAEQGWPGVWLTPVLTRPEIANALLDSSTPGLLVGGTADELWDSELATRSRSRGARGRRRRPHPLHGRRLEGVLRDPPAHARGRRAVRQPARLTPPVGADHDTGPRRVERARSRRTPQASRSADRARPTSARPTRRRSRSSVAG